MVSEQCLFGKLVPSRKMCSYPLLPWCPWVLPKTPVLVPDLYIQDHSFLSSQLFKLCVQSLSLEWDPSTTVSRSRYHHWSPLSDPSFWNKCWGLGAENHQPRTLPLMISCTKETLCLFLTITFIETFWRQHRYFRIIEPSSRVIHCIPFSP